MKSIHGKLLLLLLFTLSLSANPLAKYELTTNKQTPYIKEAVEITFTAEQLERTDVMFFFLEPQASKEYKITLLKKESTELAYHHKKTTYHYLLFPLKSKDIDVRFHFTIKVASDEAVAQVYEGSRDNVKWIETDNTQIPLKPLTLHVKALQKDVSLVGDFTLQQKVAKTEISAYDTLQVKYFLKGVGFDEFHLELIPPQKGIDIFTNITKHYNKATPDGFVIQQEYNYALVAKEDFTIPKKSILCFSPKKKLYYTLETKAYKIHVTPMDATEILDSNEAPSEPFFYEKVADFFLYLLIFAAGYFTAKISYKKEKKELDKEPFSALKEAKNAKEMLFLLTNRYAEIKALYPFHKELEELVYKNKQSKNFTKIKKAILEKIDEISNHILGETN